MSGIVRQICSIFRLNWFIHPHTCQAWIITGASSVSGLVHVSEISWDPVRNPRDLLEEGQTVRVKVIQLDT